jgi:hypothetical protein
VNLIIDLTDPDNFTATLDEPNTTTSLKQANPDPNDETTTLTLPR